MVLVLPFFVVVLWVVLGLHRGKQRRRWSTPRHHVRPHWIIVKERFANITAESPLQPPWGAHARELRRPGR